MITSSCCCRSARLTTATLTSWGRAPTIDAKRTIYSLFYEELKRPIAGPSASPIFRDSHPQWPHSAYPALLSAHDAILGVRPVPHGKQGNGQSRIPGKPGDLPAEQWPGSLLR